MVLPRNLILFWLVGRTKTELSFNCQKRTVLLLSGNRGKNNIDNKEKEQVKRPLEQPSVRLDLYPVFSQREEQEKRLIKQPDIEPGLYPAFSQREEQVKKLIKQPPVEPGLYPVFSQREEQEKRLIKQPYVEPGLYPVFSQREEQEKRLIKQPYVEPGLYPVFSQREEQEKRLIKQPYVEPSLNPVFSHFETTHSLNNNYKTKTNSKTEFLDSNKKNPKDLIFGKKQRHFFFPQKKSSYSSMLFCSQTLKDRFWSPLDVRTVHSIAPTSDLNQNLLLPNNTHCRGFHHIGASPSSSFTQASQLPSKRTQGLCVKKGVEKTPVCTPNVPFPSASSSHGYATSNNRDRGPHNRGWLTLEGYRIYPWSISGLETCIVLRSESDKKFSVTFDLGYSTRPSVRCQHVFISHGHMDHVAGLFQHATKRNLYNLPPATYYVPPNLVETLQRVGQMLYTLSSTPEILQRLDIRPIQPGDRVLVSPDYEVRPFATIHRVPSQGYLLYRRHKRLKRLYQHLTPEEVSEMQKQSKEEIFYDVSWIPDLAYTGDTTFELFLNSPPADLLKVRLLILEATYLESVTPGIIEKARERGHTHVAEIIENSHLFADVEKLLLIHLSDKYSSRFARDALAYQMTPDLLRKVVIATLAKDRS